MDSACPHCGFRLAEHPTVTAYRKVQFKSCPFCAKKIKSPIVVTHPTVTEAEAPTLHPAVFDKLES